MSVRGEPVRRALPLRRPPRRLRAGVTQLLFAGAGAAGGFAAAQIRIGPGVPTGRVVEMLTAIGFGVLGVASIVFSLLFLVVQWADSHLTPRLTLFREDPFVWWTFAYVIGIFTFCTATVLALGGRETASVYIPVIALILLLGALAVVRNLQVRAFASIQLAPALDAVTARGEEILRILYDTGTRTGTVDPGPVTATITWPRGICVLQHLDIRGLTTAAADTGTVIVMRQQVGATLRTGTPVATIHGGMLAADAVVSKLVVGSQPTFGQDPLLALRILADIALRALSPAVNDPATAVQALDHIHQLLADVAGHPGRSGAIADATGTTRVLLDLPTWDDFLSTALADLVAVDTTSPMVNHRRISLLTDLAAAVNLADRARIDVWLQQLGQSTNP